MFTVCYLMSLGINMSLPSKPETYSSPPKVSSHLIYYCLTVFEKERTLSIRSILLANVNYTTQYYL